MAANPPPRPPPPPREGQHTRQATEEAAEEAAGLRTTPGTLGRLPGLSSVKRGGKIFREGAPPSGTGGVVLNQAKNPGQQRKGQLPRFGELWDHDFTVLLCFFPPTALNICMHEL